MRVEVIQAINNNLQQLALLINVLDTKTYLDVSVGPYYSSIGSHSRHILDFFNCIIDGLDENKICLLYTSPSPRDQRGSRMPSSA